MWIKISNRIFESADFKSLNYLYQILSWSPAGSFPRYSIAVDTEGVGNSTNFKQLLTIESDLKEFLDLEYADFVNSSAYNSDETYTISNTNKKKNFNIEEAILFFNQPVSIVLENNKNDSQFIEAIIKNFGNKNGKNLAQQHLDCGWLQFENAGGCSNIPNFLESVLKRFTKIAEKNKRPLSTYFRGLIILDSDRDFKAQPCKHSSLTSKLTKLGIKEYHILKKRAMENYLPKEVFIDIQQQLANNKNAVEIKEWLDVFLTFSDEQLDYVNIATGFPPKSKKYDNNGKRVPVENEILTLFNMKITDSNFEKIDLGFKFQGVSHNNNLKTDSSFKNEFPNLFRKSKVTQQSLNVRDGENELTEILQKITNLL